MKLHRARLNSLRLSFSSQPLLTPKSLLQPSAGLAPASLSLPGTDKPRVRHSTPGIDSTFCLLAYRLPHKVAYNFFFFFLLCSFRTSIKDQMYKMLPKNKLMGREKNEHTILQSQLLLQNFQPFRRVVFFVKVILFSVNCQHHKRIITTSNTSLFTTQLK